jgi:hypothetical protein
LHSLLRTFLELSALHQYRYNRKNSCYHNHRDDQHRHVAALLGTLITRPLLIALVTIRWAVAFGLPRPADSITAVDADTARSVDYSAGAGIE